MMMMIVKHKQIEAGKSLCAGDLYFPNVCRIDICEQHLVCCLSSSQLAFSELLLSS